MNCPWEDQLSGRSEKRKIVVGLQELEPTRGVCVIDLDDGATGAIGAQGVEPDGGLDPACVVHAVVEIDLVRDPARSQRGGRIGIK